MGVVRLLAKGWIIFCLFATAHAIQGGLQSGVSLQDTLMTRGVCALLFLAMGLLFIGGYAAAIDHGNAPLIQRIKPHHFLPGFNDLVFLVFVALSFSDQIFFSAPFMQNSAVGALQSAIHFAVPGQRALEYALEPCGLDGGRVFASSFAWLLAVIYLASSLSRLKLASGIIRLERSQRPEPLTPAVLALLLGVISVVGIQFLFVGAAFQFLPCSAFTEITGALLIGLAPLMLAYLIVAALANLMATGPE